MDYKKSGEIIAEARREKGYTQKEVAARLNVSDKAVSKWERGAGCPDVRILSDLADVLEIDAKALLSGIAACNNLNNGNMKQLKFYVCPSCGNIVTSTNSTEIGCCGKKIKALKVNKEDKKHTVLYEIVDNEYYVRVVGHQMSKKHFISFMCYVTSDRSYLVKLYPEQNCEARFKKDGHGILYIYCNEDGLFQKNI